MQLTFQFIILQILIFICQTLLTEKISIDEINTQQSCECVPFLLCENGSEIIDGAGLIDVRSNFEITNIRNQRSINECENILEVCCEPPKVKSSEKESASLISTQWETTSCGIRNFDGVDLRIMSEKNNEAKLGEFSWMVVILHSTIDELDIYQCGGALIHRKVVLTAAHCVFDKNASSLKIRAGEWDTQTTDESLPHQDRAVEATIIHENYNYRSLKNDFALLILSEPVTIIDNVDIICLPNSKYEYDSRKCVASGWGKDKFGKDGRYQEILKNVQLSIISPYKCQQELRRTILGKKFILDKSFICAGGVKGEDMCKGDGGSPLICPLKKNFQQYVQVGIVSWGIGCGNEVPGVYGNVLFARPWIDEQLMLHNLDNSIYQQRHVL